MKLNTQQLKTKPQWECPGRAFCHEPHQQARRGFFGKALQVFDLVSSLEGQGHRAVWRPDPQRSFQENGGRSQEIAAGAGCLCRQLGAADSASQSLPGSLLCLWLVLGTSWGHRWVTAIGAMETSQTLASGLCADPSLGMKSVNLA